MNDDDSTEKDAVDEALAYIEGVNNVVGMLDSIKTGLEARGWSPSPAAVAATTLGNTLLMAGAMKGTEE